MPRKPARRNRRRRPRKNVASTTVVRYREIMSKRTFVKLSYDSGSVGTSTTTIPGLIQFRMNSIFEPSIPASLTKQPRGFDQYSTLYNNYIVHGCRAEVIAQNLSPGTAAILCLYAHDKSVYPLNVRAMQELPDARTCVFTTDKACVKSIYYNMPRLFAITKAKYTSDDLYAEGMGGSPTNIAYLNVQWINLDEITSTGFSVRVKLTYFVELFDPKKLSSS